MSYIAERAIAARAGVFLALEEARPKKLPVALIAAIVVVVILAGALGYALVLLGSPEPETVTYPIGLAIATTGATYATDGPIRKDAASLAIEQMNARLEAARARIRFSEIHEDTGGTTDGANDAYRSLQTARVQVVVGPLSTGEVSAIRQFVTDNKIVTISPSSTGVGAAIPNDYVFRAAPTDIPQAKALAQLVDRLNFTEVAVLARQDDYGVGFATLFEQVFETDYGGTVLVDTYAPGTQDFAPEVLQLRQNIDTLGAGANTSVLVVTFEEGVDIFDEARLDTVLRGVRWFGSESTRRSAWLNRTAIPDVVDFLIDVDFSGFFASPADQPVKLAFEQAYVAKYPGRNPAASPYSYFSYDSAMLAMEAVLAAGKYDGEAIANILPWVAEHYFGATGHKILNANGDALGADYRAWRIVADTPSRAKFQEFAVWAWQTEELEIYG